VEENQELTRHKPNKTPRKDGIKQNKKGEDTSKTAPVHFRKNIYQVVDIYAFISLSISP
jgi:hypothetical protein